MLARAASFVAGAAILPACVTQNVQFEPPRNYPPSIESAPTAAHPLNEIVFLGVGTEEDAGVSNNLVLDVIVRDPNVADTLEYQVFVLHGDTAPLPIRIDGDAIPPQEGAIERSRRIMLPLTFFPDRPNTQCQRLELFVSREFQGGLNNRLPVEDGDLATATWWIARGLDVPLEACPRP